MAKRWLRYLRRRGSNSIEVAGGYRDARRALTIPRAGAIAFCLFLTHGCGTKPSVAPISGIVTFQGRPLVGATITTQPIGANSENPGSGSFGRTDDQGRFELELVTPAMKGAIIGEHRVLISPASSPKAESQSNGSAAVEAAKWKDDPNGNRLAAGNSWPAQFGDGSLRLQVPPEGAADVRFDLKP
jgi:hypothetical protein